MKLDPIHQMLQPLFGVERSETTSRFLYAILIGSLIVNSILIILRSLNGATLQNSFTLRVLAGLLIAQLFLLLIFKRGYVTQAALLLVGLFWIAATYQAWNADGVRDVAIYVYILLIFIAALLTNWRFSIALVFLSILSIWFFAISEIRGLRVPHADSPINMARDLTAVFVLLVLVLYLVMNTLRRSLDALRRSEARMRALLDAHPDMIFEFTRDGTIIQFIASSINRPLVPPEQFMGKRISEVLPSVADQTLFAIERVLESEQVHAFEYQLFQEGENRTFEARIAPLSADTALAIVRDVSLQKWILGEREDLINELESKNAELERFSYTVSHDLKSPLITIKGFLGFLDRDAKTGNLERLNSDIQRISDAADKMQLLLNDLLELSRIGRLINQPEDIELIQLIYEVLELLHGRLHGGKIQVRVAENLPRIYGDRPRLFEVMQNLIDNAAKFMGDQPDPLITIGQEGSTESGVPILFVRDNGIGIDPRFKDRIFGLFDKLDPRTDGTGVGLALAKRIIELHGGRIWVESEPGSGATFYFTLPQSETAYRNAG